MPLNRKSINARAIIRVAAVLLAIMILSSGCAKHYRFGEHPERQTPYEIVWVEPTIIASDSLVTLIRSDRVDSLKTEDPSDRSPKKASIDFQVDRPTCDVSVNLLNIRGILVRPLLVQNLSPGYYRLTFQPERLSEPSLPPGDYLLEVRYCDREHLSSFVVR